MVVALARNLEEREGHLHAGRVDCDVRRAKWSRPWNGRRDARRVADVHLEEQRDRAGLARSCARRVGKPVVEYGNPPTRPRQRLRQRETDAAAATRNEGRVAKHLISAIPREKPNLQRAADRADLPGTGPPVLSHMLSVLGICAEM